MRQSLVSSIRRYLLVLSGFTTTRILTSYILKRIGVDIPTLMAALLSCTIFLGLLLSRHRKVLALAR